MNRRGQRRATNVTVQFVTRPAVTGVGFVTNISPTGAFMETRFPLPLLSLVYLESTDPAPAARPRSHLAATVVRCSATGVGLEWCEFGAETTDTYARFADLSDEFIDSHQLSLPDIPQAARSFEARPTASS
jgi:hypothetical protein